MTSSQFRQLALVLPETIESAHMGHPDFRVKGKIFATLGPDESAEKAWGMVKLTSGQQAKLLAAEPENCQPANGAWGARGATIVTLRRAKKSLVASAIEEAWRNTAPQTLVREYDEG